MSDLPLGVHDDMPYEEYEQLPAANISFLKEFARSPKHARIAYLSSKSTDAMLLGSYIDSLVLTPHEHLERYVTMPDFTVGITNKDGSPSKNPRATSQYKKLVEEFEAKNIGRTVIPEEYQEKAKRIRESLFINNTARRLLQAKGRNQLTIVSKIEDIPVKCRIDMERESEGFLVDLKTTRDASYFGFSKSIRKFGYHHQASFYLRIAKQVGIAVDKFLVMAVENEPPHAVATYRISDNDLVAAENEWLTWLRQWSYCFNNNCWPGYPDHIQDIEVTNINLRQEGDN